MKIKVRSGVIYQTCKDLGVSRDELSRRMGVASTTAFRVDKGDVDPSAKFIAGLIHVTGEPFEALFDIVELEKAG